jgi:hypothetical protein
MCFGFGLQLMCAIAVACLCSLAAADPIETDALFCTRSVCRIYGAAPPAAEPFDVRLYVSRYTVTAAPPPIDSRPVVTLYTDSEHCAPCRRLDEALARSPPLPFRIERKSTGPWPQPTFVWAGRSGQTYYRSGWPETQTAEQTAREVDRLVATWRLNQ